MNAQQYLIERLSGGHPVEAFLMSPDNKVITHEILSLTHLFIKVPGGSTITDVQFDNFPVRWKPWGHAASFASPGSLDVEFKQNLDEVVENGFIKTYQTLKPTLIPDFKPSSSMSQLLNDQMYFPSPYVKKAYLKSQYKIW